MNNDDGSLQFSSDPQAIRRLSGQFGTLNVATTSDNAAESPNAFDCSILINGERLWAKKMALARHSLFFYTKFVLEAYNEIELSDIRLEVMRSVLQFCHDGRVDTSGTDEEVLHAANRCQVSALKDICENRLCISASESNFVERWKLASECDSKKLAEKCASIHKIRQQEMQENVLSKAMNVLQLDATNNHMSYIS